MKEKISDKTYKVLEVIIWPLILFLGVGFWMVVIKLLIKLAIKLIGGN